MDDHTEERRPRAPDGGPPPTATAIGIDVGGTKILGALVDARGRVLAQEVVGTPREEGPLVAAIVGLASQVSDLAGPDVPIGVGFPALLTLDGRARYGPNIVLREFPLGEALSSALGRRVVLDNDANCATWAEFTVGAGRAASGHMMMFTLGTGVGGGLVVDGRLVRGANGFAGELGHVVIEVDGRVGASGIPGEVEAYSSGTAFGELIAAAAARGGFAGTALEAVAPPAPAAVVEAARQGMPLAVDLLADMGRHLGIAAAGLANVLDPEVIVVGGGAAAGGELILDPARAALHAHLLGAEHRPPIPVVAAALGPEAGAVGAALLALAA